MTALPAKFSRSIRHPFSPLILLLAVNLTVALLTFQNFGLSWDEPLFYKYADAIRMAYTPQAFTPGFDFNQVYGPSATDHKFYGPAYILLAWPVQRGIMSLGADEASAWHLVNFLTFEIGLIAFYAILRRWIDPWPAAATTAFFAWQPVLWGHAFINPKDMPFMVFFMAAMALGLDAVDHLSGTGKPPRGRLILAGIMLGLTVAVRVIGPLAGVLILAYALLQKKWRAIPWLVGYGALAILVAFVFWPFLWFGPVQRLIEVAQHMADNPTQLNVLFLGQTFPAGALPRRYFPQMLATKLTEPTWLLFAAGLLLAIRQAWQKKLDWRMPAVIFTWFFLMFAYVVIVVPPMYDGFRHFLFTLPPVFLLGGFAFQWLYDRLHARRLWGLAVFTLMLPGLWNGVQLHPYEYAYYNALVGGTRGAFRSYETEYWLTCYKESIAWVQQNDPQATLHIQREFDLAQYYGGNLHLKDLQTETEDDIQPGDLLLFSTRTNLDERSIYRRVPVLHAIGREGADFCLIKQKD